MEQNPHLVRMAALRSRQSSRTADYEERSLRGRSAFLALRSSFLEPHCVPVNQAAGPLDSQHDEGRSLLVLMQTPYGATDAASVGDNVGSSCSNAFLGLQRLAARRALGRHGLLSEEVDLYFENCSM